MEYIIYLSIKTKISVTCTHVLTFYSFFMFCVTASLLVVISYAVIQNSAVQFGIYQTDTCVTPRPTELCVATTVQNEWIHTSYRLRASLRTFVVVHSFGREQWSDGFWRVQPARIVFFVEVETWTSLKPFETCACAVSDGRACRGSHRSVSIFTV